MIAPFLCDIIHNVTEEFCIFNACNGCSMKTVFTVKLSKLLHFLNGGFLLILDQGDG